MADFAMLPMPASLGSASWHPSDDNTTLSPLTLRFAIGIIIVVLLLSLLSKWTVSDSKKYSPTFIKHIKSLVQHASQWSTVSKQDDNPLIALMHINYALSYAYIAKRLIPSREIEKIANVNLDELVYLLEDEQLQAMQRINQVCPKLQPDGVFAVHTGWLA